MSDQTNTEAVDFPAYDPSLQVYVTPALPDVETAAEVAPEIEEAPTVETSSDVAPEVETDAPLVEPVPADEHDTPNADETVSTSIAPADENGEGASA